MIKFNLLSFNTRTFEDGLVVYYKGNAFYNGELVNISLDTPMNFLPTLRSLNNNNVANITSKFRGAFSFVIVKENNVFLLSDIIRTYPFFYSVTNNQIDISDTLNVFSDCNIKKDNVSSLITSGYIFGNETIYDNVHTVQAAELITIDIKTCKIQSSRYFKFIPNINAEAIPLDSFVDKYNETMDLVMKRIILSAPSCRNWIVPLSGGHDSRQLINSLYKLGITNVICFTYGQIENHQAVLSEQVARAVNYEWHFIEYTEKKWLDLHSTGLIDKYLDDTYQGNSIPHLQDFLAVYELIEKGIIQRGDVVLPGHALDMIAGSHLSDLDVLCDDKASSIKRTAYKFSKQSNKHNLTIYNNYQKLLLVYDEIVHNPRFFQEFINWQERQTKFIANSCKIYEFFELEFRMPFWEREIIDLFLSLSTEQRKSRNLYLAAERKGILTNPLSAIPFESELNSKSTKYNLQQEIISLIPNKIKSILSSLVKNKNYEAESLNQIFALKGTTVADVIGSIEKFPRDTHSFLKPNMIRYTHRTDNELLTSLYALSRIIEV